MSEESARREWSRMIDRVSNGGERVLVERNGVPAAAIVSPEDLIRLQHLDDQRRKSFEAIEAFGEPFKDEDPEEAERQVAAAVVEARAASRPQSTHPQ